MKTVNQLYIAFYLATTWSFALAVDVKSENEYYYIDPKTASDVDRLIFSHAPSNNADGSGMKIVGSYASSMRMPSIQVKRTINRKTGVERCAVTKIGYISLYGKFMFPKLVPNNNYLDSVLTKFDIESKKIIDHEKKHEDIYVSELRTLKARIGALTQTGPSSCKILMDHANADYAQTHNRIQERNIAFDCYEYGNQYDLAKCKKYHKEGVKTGGASSFSSLQDPTETGANVQSYKEKPKADECKGKLIEPFKGKFYCISGDYK